jgi:hypothetical protein
MLFCAPPTDRPEGTLSVQNGGSRVSPGPLGVTRGEMSDQCGVVPPLDLQDAGLVAVMGLARAVAGEDSRL